MFWIKEFFIKELNIYAISEKMEVIKNSEYSLNVLISSFNPSFILFLSKIYFFNFIKFNLYKRTKSKRDIVVIVRKILNEKFLKKSTKPIKVIIHFNVFIIKEKSIYYLFIFIIP